jgi:hypothetical protein
MMGLERPWLVNPDKGFAPVTTQPMGIDVEPMCVARILNVPDGSGLRAALRWQREGAPAGEGEGIQWSAGGVRAKRAS